VTNSRFSIADSAHTNTKNCIKKTLNFELQKRRIRLHFLNSIGLNINEKMKQANQAIKALIVG
jgi:hypothetical protein